EDLQPGMELSGTVRNVVDFGAFVDIGVKQDGLVHVSELADRFVRDPLTVVAVGQVVRVRVLSVDVGRGRVQLSMRGIAH
ncbi:MAG TPA: S1 RNA-binding domain-containing protein, partial [Ktedonobacterales bacterium]|nr:S1 RNA-binding domain-containing protein [Ktedonobacterales bacterium]